MKTDSLAARATGGLPKRDAFGAQSDARRPHEARFEPALSDALADAAGVGSGSRVLFLGPEASQAAHYLSTHYGCRVVACDGGAVTREDTAAGPERQSGRHFSPMDMPFGAGTFDVVLLLDVLSALDDPVGVLVECERVLRQSGRLAFSEVVLSQSAGSCVGAALNDARHSRHVNAYASYLKTLERTGLTVESAIELMLDASDFRGHRRRDMSPALGTAWDAGALRRGQYLCRRLSV
ncbi:MAG: methyltransferase domain-containing protein [Pseudomonadota bacterium]